MTLYLAYTTNVLLGINPGPSYIATYNGVKYYVVSSNWVEYKEDLIDGLGNSNTQMSYVVGAGFSRTNNDYDFPDSELRNISTVCIKYSSTNSSFWTQCALYVIDVPSQTVLATHFIQKQSAYASIVFSSIVSSDASYTYACVPYDASSHHYITKLDNSISGSGADVWTKRYIINGAELNNSLVSMISADDSTLYFAKTSPGSSSQYILRVDAATGNPILYNVDETHYYGYRIGTGLQNVTDPINNSKYLLYSLSVYEDFNGNDVGVTRFCILELKTDGSIEEHYYKQPGDYTLTYETYLIATDLVTDEAGDIYVVADVYDATYDWDVEYDYIVVFKIDGATKELLWQQEVRVFDLEYPGEEFSLYKNKVVIDNTKLTIPCDIYTTTNHKHIIQLPLYRATADLEVDIIGRAGNLVVRDYQRPIVKEDTPPVPLLTSGSVSTINHAVTFITPFDPSLQFTSATDTSLFESVTEIPYERFGPCGVTWVLESNNVAVA